MALEVNAVAVEGSCETTVQATAVAQGCGSRIPEDTTIVTIPNIQIDGDAPVVSCILAEQALSGNGAGVFTDLQFSFSAQDGGNGCTAPEDLEVEISFFSTEVVTTGDEMVVISSASAEDGSVAIFAEDSVCRNASSGKCKISSTSGSREYSVTIKATDKAGNVGTGTCSTAVGNGNGNGNDNGNIFASNDPRFLIASLKL